MKSTQRLITSAVVLFLTSKVVWCETGLNLTQLYENVCGYPMGDDIDRNGFSASSFKAKYPPRNVRFNRNLSGWRPTANDTFQWIQADLPDEIHVTGVLTEGAVNEALYVRNYKVEYSRNGIDWMCILDEHGKTKIYEGNIDSSTPRINHFRPAVIAQFIRITPIKWHNGIAMHLEVFGGGCEECWE